MTESVKKVALVTGGNRGIGKDIAHTLARNGVGVILTYRSNEQEARAVVEEIRAAGGKSAAFTGWITPTSWRTDAIHIPLACRLEH